MKQMGRKHRQFFRICACDERSPRDGRVIEEIGTYDPQVKDTDARAILNHERVSYWLGVGAKPSEKVAILIKKYGPSGTHADAQRAAREKLAGPKAIPDPGEARYKVKTKEELAAEAEAKAAEEAAAKAAAEAAAAEAPAESAEAPAEAPAAAE
jgi:small subunit ribosomal protein S16